MTLPPATSAGRRAATPPPRRADPVRAGLFIGVNRAHDMPPLQAAGTGARDMRGWALRQGVPERNTRLITDDEGQKVGVDQVQTAIEELLAGPGLDQLVVYFAGHGVVACRTEHWLLSDAPHRAQQAINVAGSVELARACGVGHVVLISDACRSASDDLRLGRVYGQDLFPNDSSDTPATPVDQLFACAPGRAALELRVPDLAAGSYQAVYTTVLLEALGGRFADLLQDSGDPADLHHYVEPRALNDFLAKEIPRRILDLDVPYRDTQRPDAIITSSNQWIARIPLGPDDERRRGGSIQAGPSRRMREQAAGLVRTARTGDVRQLRREMSLIEDRSDDPQSAPLRRLTRQVRQTLPAFGPDGLPTGCGIKVRGARMRDWFVPGMSVTQVDDQVLRIDPGDERFASAVLEFADGTGTVVPVFAGGLTTLTVVGGELVDVGVERATGASTALRATRVVAAAAAGHSRLDLDAALTDELLGRPRGGFLGDPVLAAYLATMLHERQEDPRRIDDLQRDLCTRFGAGIFDVGMLGSGPGARVVPCTPLLTRNWALLRARRIDLHPALDGLAATLLDSTLSMYQPAGVDRLRQAIASGGPR